MKQEEARKVIMMASQKAIAEYRKTNPIDLKNLDEYLSRQMKYVNDYVRRTVSFDIRSKAM